jgi:hypothetical protein
MHVFKNPWTGGVQTWGLLFLVRVDGGEKMFCSCCRIVAGNGMSTRFWEDRWINDPPISCFPRLSSISLNVYITVNKDFAIGIRNLKFRREIVWQKKDQWLQLCDFSDVVTLSNDPDKIWWKLSRVFTV